MLQTSGRVSFFPSELYNTEAGHVAGLPLHAVQSKPVVPFMVQGPLISTGSCTYFMDTSLLERGGRGGMRGIRAVGWSHPGGGWWWTVPLLPVHRRPFTLQQKVLDQLVKPLAALKLTWFDVTRPRLFDWTECWKTQRGVHAVQNAFHIYLKKPLWSSVVSWNLFSQ